MVDEERLQQQSCAEVRAIERSGGRVVPCEPTQEAREQAAAREAATAGGAPVLRGCSVATGCKISKIFH